MNSRFKQFGASFGSKRNSNRNVSAPQNSSSLIPAPIGITHPPVTSASSTTSLPMNPPQNGLGRPPSYTYNSNARPTSPMPPTTQQTMHHPPPINTGAYSQGHPALAGAAQQPPGYGGGYAQPNGMHNPPQQPSAMGQYAARGQAVEVEGAGRSKAQLIVGIDFVRLPSSAGTMINANMSLGNHFLRCRICLRDQHGGEGGYNYRMARRWKPNEAEGNATNCDRRNKR